MSNGRKGKLRQTVIHDDGSTSEQELDVLLKKKNINSGWNMTYKDPLYDFIEVLTKAQFKLYRFLEELIISKIGKDVKVEASKLASGKAFAYRVKYDDEDTLLLSPTKDSKAISKMLTMMTKNNIIMETSPKHYRYNPFIILPQFADGERLQNEWREIQKNGPFKRRGRNILDEYYDHKIKTKQYKLTFENWLKENEDVKIEPGIITESKQEEPKTDIPDMENLI